ncbi:MAG: DNA methyltransferase, partial [Dethiobacteria bacterium]
MNRIANYLKSFTFQDNNDNIALSPSNGKKTIVNYLFFEGQNIPVYINEFWTAKQRQASSIHEISYRACFKPQLPRFFINLLTEAGDLVYDPFSGRGTTIIEAALLGRKVAANDINPLSKILAEPRLNIPSEKQIAERLYEIPYCETARAEMDLSMFYAPQTEAEIVSLKKYLQSRRRTGCEDNLDRWIRMLATNRLTGHSPGFFSVYTLPPNQAVLPERQQMINRKRNQKPEYRDTRKLILKKFRSLIRNLKINEIKNLRQASKSAL